MGEPTTIYPCIRLVDALLKDGFKIIEVDYIENPTLQCREIEHIKEEKPSYEVVKEFGAPLYKKGTKLYLVTKTEKTCGLVIIGKNVFRSCRIRGKKYYAPKKYFGEEVGIDVAEAMRLTKIGYLKELI